MQSLLYLSLGIVLFLVGLGALALHLRTLRARVSQKRSAAALQELAAKLVRDVDHFDGQVRTISGDLEERKPNVGADDVLEALDRIGHVSETMRTQLKDSEEKIREQAETLEEHVLEGAEALIGLAQAAGLGVGSEERRVTRSDEAEPSSSTLPSVGPQAPTPPEAALVVDESRDPMTGLPNRAAFLDDLKLRLATLPSGPVTTCLAMLRIDRFGEILSERGFRAAETVLIRSAESLTAAMRGGDHAARFDRDTFVLYLADLSPDDAPAAVERLRRSVSQPVEIGSAQAIQVTVSSSFAPIEASAEAAQLVARCRGTLALATTGEALGAG
jgi:diguanylate cyclase (GGDEF)-like protein